MKRLTTTPGVDNAPAWAPIPGMNVIAFQRLDPATGRSDIWVMDSNGANQRNLTADMPIDLSRGEPAWSRDGEWIAFTSSRWTAGPGRGSLWIMRGDGSEKRQLTVNPGNGFDLSPSWSPDGQRIAFQRGGISIVAVATGAVTNLGLPGMSLQPSWSPDGRHIAFAWQPLEPGAGDLQLYTVRADGTGMRLRTTNPAWGGGVSPTWIAR
jgi:Tol biopolymer transport system component